jgi:MFS family permease
VNPPVEYQGERPSHTRYVVLAFMCSLAFVLYLDRICISQAGTDIKRDLNLNNTQFSYVLAAFTLAYALFEVPIGWWGDKYGSRGVLARIVIAWSIFTALTGAAWNLMSLMSIRFLFGAGEAGAFPNTARILSRWFPTERRGMAQGLVNSISQIGGAVAPPLTAYLMTTIGWRWTFAAFCLPGILWAAIFYWWFRDDPQLHPSVNESERRLITAGTAARHAAEHPPIPWRLIFKCPPIWLLGAVLACTAFNSYFYFSWYPTYLKEARLAPEVLKNVPPEVIHSRIAQIRKKEVDTAKKAAAVPSKKEGSAPAPKKISPLDLLTKDERKVVETRAGNLASIVLIGGAIGSIGGGILIDFLVRRTGNRHRSRRRYSSVVLCLAAICLIVGKQSDAPDLATIWTAASVMFTLSTLASWWGAVTDISGRHLGALFGLMNSLGGVGAIVSQLFVGRYADYMQSYGYEGRAQWDSIFFVYSGVLIVGACGWRLVDSSKSVDGVST